MSSAPNPALVDDPAKAGPRTGSGDGSRFHASATPACAAEASAEEISVMKMLKRNRSGLNAVSHQILDRMM